MPGLPGISDHAASCWWRSRARPRAAGDLHSGPCAVTTALVSSGPLPTGRFLLEASLPAKARLRRQACRSWPRNAARWCLFESGPHRWSNCWRTLSSICSAIDRLLVPGTHQNGHEQQVGPTVEGRPGSTSARCPPAAEMATLVLGGAPAPKAPQWSEHELQGGTWRGAWQRASVQATPPASSPPKTASPAADLRPLLPATPKRRHYQFAALFARPIQQSESTRPNVSSRAACVCACCSPASWRPLLLLLNACAWARRNLNNESGPCCSLALPHLPLAHRLFLVGVGPLVVA